ncbi:MAG: hypothetical protein EZS28_029866 [Streblomastix strix]|uniref:Uncharacterized protein n=1 Tax=Streblomastix strix TaxID=222440 RepID=A0A5J4UWD6_9EUKA|nr:MAG: hypothetical protein EZS28_029866 [Streblomastix strix]
MDIIEEQAPKELTYLIQKLYRLVRWAIINSCLMNKGVINNGVMNKSIIKPIFDPKVYESEAVQQFIDDNRDKLINGMMCRQAYINKPKSVSDERFKELILSKCNKISGKISDINSVGGKISGKISDMNSVGQLEKITLGSYF